MTLYYLQDCGTLTMIVNSFGIATNTALALRVGPKYLHLPKTNREIKEKILEFETKVGMIQLFGCIAGTHVPFACPSEHSHDYFRYKKLHLLIVQAVCDYKRFIGVEYKRLGSFHNP